MIQGAYPSDDEDSLSGDPNLESGGDKVDERDMRSDHSARQLDFDDEIDPTRYSESNVQYWILDMSD